MLSLLVALQDVFEAADHVAEDVFRDAQEDISAESPTADYHEAGKCQAKIYVQQQSPHLMQASISNIPALS